VTKIVIIGASGFVGSALTLHLNQDQNSVTGVSRYAKPGLVQVDSYRDCPKGDVLIHLAEESDIHKANLLGEDYLNESNALTLALCEKFVSKVIYCSSAAVYGDKNTQANTEHDLLLDTNLYSKLKIQNEKIVLEHGGCVLRLANLYGVGMSANNVLSDILIQIGKPGPVRLRSTAPIRDFLYIQDLVSAISLMIDGFQSGVFNVGSGVGLSIAKLAETVLSVSGEANREIISVNPNNQDSINFLDTSKISSVLGWRPKHPLQENIHSMLENST
jgi:nucleoside-diphosphate-sugar epimerase